MRVVLFGATGMIGQGVLRECLRDPRVWRVLAIGRARSAVSHEKLEQLAHSDLLDYTPIADRLVGADACFFCLGITSAGLREAEYRRITVDFAVAAAEALLKASPRIRMCFVSGTGADSTERSRTMWARVKGRAEKRTPRAALRRGHHLPARHRAAAARHHVTHPVDPRHLRRARPADPARGALCAGLRNNHRTHRPRNDPHRRPRFEEARPRKRRHQRGGRG